MQRKQLHGIARRADAGLETTDTLLDHFIPAYEVSERHQVRVAAPAEITLAAAQDMDLLQAPVARWIYPLFLIEEGARGSSGFP